ncbi:MAG: hypothetical protein F4X02_10630 [Chloroflexi bacterium]|nr:hypothetical protein [Chloroflexota bacterium]
MRHIWSVLCRYAIEDRDSNNFSLIETLSQVSFKGDIPPERPIGLPISFHIVSQWRRGNDQDRCDYPVQMRVIAPGDVELDSDELTAKLSAYDTCTTVFSSGSFRYTENGLYEFEISYRLGERWIAVTRIPLNVIHDPAEPEEQESEPTE